MAFGQDVLSGFFGNDYVRDFAHASKTFRTNGYENSPRLKFLFHVYFNLNTVGVPPLRTIFQNGQQSTIGLLVKDIELPKFKIDHDVMNQYNRKRIVQKRINYDPINLTFHDDGGDLIRNMWYNYYSYYYKDPSQSYQGRPNLPSDTGINTARATGFDYNVRDIYENNRAVNDWGYIGESYFDGSNAASGKQPFFKDITIYGFDQHRYAAYVLINPMIISWSHDQYDYSAGDGVMEHKVAIAYETVKYYNGEVGKERPDTNAAGFADPNAYDTRPSPISRPGSTGSVLGQGGLLDAGIGVITDLQKGSLTGLLSAARTIGSASRQKYDFKQEGINLVKAAIPKGPFPK
jgi:hypothetical protein